MGADYKHARLDDYQHHAGGNNIVAGTTSYFSINNFTPNILQTEVRAGVTSRITHVYANVSVAPGAGEDYVFTLMINGIASAATVTIENIETMADAAADVVINEGDRLTTRVVASGAAANSRGACSYRRAVMG